MHFKCAILVFSLLNLYFTNFSQEEKVADDIVENTVSNTDEDFDSENVIEDLEYLTIQPININDTLGDFTLLKQYGLINDLQLNQLKNYIKSFGTLLTTKELIAVPGFNPIVLNRLLPYISTEREAERKIGFVEQLKNGRNQLLIRQISVLEKQKGYSITDTSKSRYLGNKYKWYIKYNQKYRDQLRIGFQAEKDAGEQFFQGSNKAGFDSYSFHLVKKFKNQALKTIAVGDYELRIGQGLMTWNGFSLGKGSNATQVYKTAPKIRGFTSSNEFNFLRGASAQFQLNDIEITPWISYKKLDANFQLDTINNKSVASSIKEDGLHRTPGEIEDEKVMKQLNGGMALELEKSTFKVGVAGQYTRFGNSIEPTTRPYKKYDFNGDYAINGTAYFSMVHKNFYGFGEIATDDHFNTASLVGFQSLLAHNITTSLTYRDYDRAYYSPYADALSEGTSVKNEKGLYAGFKYTPAKSWSVESYADFFRFPWLRFRVDRPSNGSEYFVKAIYSPRRSLQAELRTKYEIREINLSGSVNPIKNLTDQKRASTRLELRYRPTNNIYLKTRLGHTWFNTEVKNENGVLIFQDITYQFNKIPLRLYGRLAVFNTPSFNSRVYAYENDLLYNFNVPAYFDEGSRWYAMANYKMKNIHLWLYSSQWIFRNRETVSSGLNEIEGNKRTDLKAQIVFKF